MDIDSLEEVTPPRRLDGTPPGELKANHARLVIASDATKQSRYERARAPRDRHVAVLLAMTIVS